MINTRLLLLEYAENKSRNVKTAKIEAIKSIREIATQIDFSSELVPIDSPERLLKLMVSLKGEQLTPQEVSVIYDISNN